MRKNWFRRRVLIVLAGVIGLCLVAGLLASASAAPSNYQPISDEYRALVELNVPQGETETFKTGFTLLADEVEVDFSEVEITIKPASFTVPQIAELLENRTYFEDGYWCSYPVDKDYWFCGPMDGSQYYCQYFEGADPVCFDNFNGG